MPPHVTTGEAGLRRGPAGRRWGLRISLFFGIFLLVTSIELVEDATSTAQRVATVFLCLAYAASYCALPILSWSRPLRTKLLVCVWLVALAASLVAMHGLRTVTLLIYATASAGILLPFRESVLLNGTVVGFFALLILFAHDSSLWGDMVTLVSVTATVTLFGAQIRTNRALHAAQEELAEAAVREERARVARDLHDLLGHSLTTITVKASLTRRLLESGEIERATDEVSSLEQLSRQALAEVRSTVSGYREPSLVAELAGVRAALAAAEITAHLPNAVDDVPPRLQGAFAYVVREGVTNVLRHSGATRCEIRLGPSWLEIRDNGPHSGAPAEGNGLTGLRERLAAVGADLTAGPLEGGGFLLRASAGTEAAPARPVAATGTDAAANQKEER
ncbi:two-component sensor histidine kinase [Virgisporangium aliadipatigenens]|uniref:Two-component sensor histidine kinase n=1 Tax=Virgisporangium aliadipatigenens TaxID=741659 RepID=A0A8J3YUI3_9ACTN|nr:histidine kinase [Virgisporangium aliadipatigenens]GIJ51929.1 two-component sensor histidine kinase [Virgisporangium aliadipatigenens]